jgi:hypothetical protein
VAADTDVSASGPPSIDFYSYGRSDLVLAVFRDDGGTWGQLTWQHKLKLSPASDGTVTYPAVAGPIRWTVGADPHPAELILHDKERKVTAVRIASTAQQAAKVAAGALETVVGQYELTPTRVLTVARDGDGITGQETGGSPFALAPAGGDGFVGHDGDRVIFLRNDQDHVSRILHYEPFQGARLAPRIDAVRAAAIEADAARRIAEAPDRFRGQTPQPGSKDAVLHGIAGLQSGQLTDDQMTAALAAKLRRQSALMVPMLKALGAVETIFFRGVGPGGYDIYGVKFANGLAEIRLLMASDGKVVDDVQFRPDGDATLGHIMACSDEAAVASRGGAAPVSVFFYNDTGADMHLYELDADGRRIPRGTVGDTMSSTVWTTVDRPWVVTNASDQCLQIVLPGLRTRFNTIEAARAVERWNAPRTVPVDGSEEMLRHYIESLGRGQPIYERMTADVATFTRQQLPLDQAILGKLGALQALSFRGVSGSGNDIYMAHFSNGTAEWRIGLTRDRNIGRIALGPQY